MIPLLTRQESRAIDQHATDALGVPGLLLMENAGRGAADVIQRELGPRLRAHGQVVVVGGPGQNGGDAWVVARHLRSAGVSVRCFIVGDPARVHGDAAVNLAALTGLGLQPAVIDGSGLVDFASASAEASLLIDGLFGTGLDRAVEGLFAGVIETMAACGRPIAALDLPSGVDADTGAVLGVAVPATLTVTFAARKRGHLQYPGRALTGALHCVGLGVPAPRDAQALCVQPADVAAALPLRAGDAHKGTAGHVLIVAGAPGRTGAALLSGRGALRVGAGLVTLASGAEGAMALDAKVVELMTAALPEVPEALGEALARLAEGKRSAVVGPGLGTDAGGRSMARTAALGLALPCVIDADGLTAFAEDPGALRAAAGPRVLTPHPGEAAALLGTDSAGVQADRHGSAARLAEASGQVVVLKGAGSIVAAPGGRCWVCDRGTPALGVAGTGDVLSGCIGALLGCLPPVEAAYCGVFLHALAGERVAVGDRGVLAAEVADGLPGALQACRRE